MLKGQEDGRGVPQRDARTMVMVVISVIPIWQSYTVRI